MQTARESTIVKLPLQAAHQKWLDFTGQPGRGTQAGTQARGDVPSAELPQEVEHGSAYFSEEGPDSTRVTMELRYNPQAVKEAGQGEDWVARRVEYYLRRFKDHAER